MQEDDSTVVYAVFVWVCANGVVVVPGRAM